MTRSLTAGGPVLRDFIRLIRSPSDTVDSDLLNSYTAAGVPSRAVDMGPFDGLVVIPFGTDTDNQLFTIRIQRLYPFYTGGTATPGIDDAPAGYMAITTQVQCQLTGTQTIDTDLAAEFSAIASTDLLCDTYSLAGGASGIVSGGEHMFVLHNPGGNGRATLMVSAMGAPKMLAGVVTNTDAVTFGVLGCRYQAQSHPRG